MIKNSISFVDQQLVSTAEVVLADAIRHHQAGRFPEAERLYRGLLASNPRNPDALHLLGLLLVRLGQPRLAVGYLERAVAVSPPVATFHLSLGDAYRTLHRYPEAIRAFRRSIRCNPSVPEAYTRLASALVKNEQYDEARDAAGAALRLQPDCAEAHSTLGLALLSNKQPGEAERCFRLAISLRPDFAEAHNNLGISLTYQRLFEDAVSAFEKAIELQPGYLEAHRNLGTVLLQLDRSADGLHAFERALELSPSIDSLAALANAQRACGMLREASESCRRALEINPESPKARFVMSTIRLLEGDWEQGWRDYEYRRKFWKLQDRTRPDGSTASFWDGSPLASQTILLYAEQGLGDTLQFVRYAALVREAGGRVLLQCQKPLRPVLETVGAEAVFSEEDTLPPFDLAIPLPSLPAAFHTRVETTPNTVPYLSADPRLVERWRQRLPGGDVLKVGVVWGGNPDHSADRTRSFHPRELAPLASVPGVALFSLQKGFHASELAEVPGGLRITSLEDESTTMADTAAILRNLDLLISIDSMPVHLAGALGVRVWTLLAHAPDWRWLLGREDTPWYPTMRLFRQPAPGDWRGVMKAVTENLRHVKPL